MDADEHGFFSLSSPNEERAGVRSYFFRIGPPHLNPLPVWRGEEESVSPNRLGRVADEPRAELAAIRDELTTDGHR